MQRKSVQSCLAILLAVILLLSACGPAAEPTAPQTSPQTAAETQAPTTAETTPAAVQTSAVPPESSAAPVETSAAPPEVKAPGFDDWLAETDGVSLLQGEGKPSPELGQPADSYTDMSTLDVYWRETNGWVKLGNLQKKEYYLVSFASAYETESLPEPMIVKKGSFLTEPAAAAVPGRNFEGWYGDGVIGKWLFELDTVKQSMTLTAVYTDTVSRRAAGLTSYDLALTDTDLDGVNACVVIFVGFTDGYVPNREKFESYFTGEYEEKRAMESVGTYFRLNSYGKISFDFYFYYYDTGMSCKEAYDYTQPEGSAHELLYQGFREFQDSYEGDPKDLDRNGDGYVDLICFVTGENTSKTVGDGDAYVIFGTSQRTERFDPDPEKPAIHALYKCLYEETQEPMIPGTNTGGLRGILHETGHVFGLPDYYSGSTDEEEGLHDTLGGFDMQSNNEGDWNVYSRFTCGWLDPYVIDESVEKVTLKIGCSSEVPDAILIPTSAGWNGTPFDEYILVDVLAPYAGNRYDWPDLVNNKIVPLSNPNRKGGVRIYHVDSRMVEVADENYPLQTVEEMLRAGQKVRAEHRSWIGQRFDNSNALPRFFSEDNRFCHLIDIIPADGSSRLRTHSRRYSWQAFDFLDVRDLFAPGSVFSMETCADAFANAPLMNNGSTFDYEVHVDFYDPDTREAIVTIIKIR